MKTNMIKELLGRSFILKKEPIIVVTLNWNYY